MSITRINNQAVELYTPTETLFNERTSVCSWHIDYFPLVTCDDVTEVVLNTSVATSDIGNDPTMDTNVTGAATSISVNKLVDSGADFDGTGGTGDPVITTSMRVHNVTDNTSAGVVSVDSATTLTLDADIFPLGTESYSISFYETSGSMAMGTGEIVKSTSGTGTFSQESILTEGDLYKLELSITSFSSTVDGAQINISISDTVVLTLDETDDVTATHTVYGYAPTGSSFDISVTADTGVAATFTDMEVSEMSSVTYTVKDCDDDSVVYTSVAADVITSATSSQIKVSFDWSELMSGYECPCGCYYIEITDGVDTFRTNCMQVCDSHDCTVKLSGTNLDNAFGIDFIGLAYNPVIRISGQLETAKYDGDKENEEDSAGVSKTLYFKSEKSHNLLIDFQPEFVHDFIRLLIGYDTFQIDDVSYIAKGASYETDASRAAGKLPDRYNANTTVRRKTDLNENKYC